MSQKQIEDPYLEAPDGILLVDNGVLSSGEFSNDSQKSSNSII